MTYKHKKWEPIEDKIIMRYRGIINRNVLAKILKCTSRQIKHREQVLLNVSDAPIEANVYDLGHALSIYEDELDQNVQSSYGSI